MESGVIDVGVVGMTLLRVTLLHSWENLYGFSRAVVLIEHLRSTSEFVCNLPRKCSPLRQPFKSCFRCRKVRVRGILRIIGCPPRLGPNLHTPTHFLRECTVINV